MADDPENAEHPEHEVPVTKSQATQGSGSKVSPEGGGGKRRPSAVQRFVGVHEVSKNWMSTIKMLTAELMGTMFLVFFGVAACVTHKGDLMSISLTFGLAVATIAQMLGHISGAHLNPAVSFGLVAAGECGIIKAALYLVAQIIGAVIGAFVVQLSLNESEAKTGISGSLSSVNIRMLNKEGKGEYRGILVEMFITFPLIFTICAVCDKGNNMKGSAPLAIGLAIALGHLAGIPFTGASMNTARSLGPLIVAMMFKLSAEVPTKHIYVYLIGPILGGVLAGLLYRFFYQFPKPEEKKE